MMWIEIACCVEYNADHITVGLWHNSKVRSRKWKNCTVGNEKVLHIIHYAFCQLFHLVRRRGGASEELSDEC